MSEVTDRLEAAVDVLIGDGPVKQRLIVAYSTYLDGVAELRLPPDAGEVFRALHAALTAVTPVGRETRIQASVQKMSPADATRYARTILDLQRMLLLAGRRADHLKVVESPQRTLDEPPQFLVGGV